MSLMHKIYIAIGFFSLSIFVAAIILGTDIRVERRIEVMGPDEPVYYMIVRGEPLEFIEKELNKRPRIVNESYIMDKTLLAYASESGRENVVKLLIDKGADPNGIGQPSEYTPLMSAVFSGKEQIAIILIEHGADPDLKSGGFGSSPREMAESLGNQQMLTILSNKEKRRLQP